MYKLFWKDEAVSMLKKVIPQLFGKQLPRIAPSLKMLNNGGNTYIGQE